MSYAQKIEELIAERDELRAELERLREKYAAAQHAADCLEAKCNALELQVKRADTNTNDERNAI